MIKIEILISLFFGLPAHNDSLVKMLLSERLAQACFLARAFVFVSLSLLSSMNSVSIDLFEQVYAQKGIYIYINSNVLDTFIHRMYISTERSFMSSLT